MFSQLEHTQFNDFLREHSREGRDVQLFGMNGQTIFPLYGDSGSLKSDVAVFPVLRGEGDHAPEYHGSFPANDGETLDLGNGWIVMCVLFGMEQTLMGKMTKLERAEEKLRAMKTESQGDN